MRLLLLLIFSISCAHIKAPKREKKYLKLIWAKNNEPEHQTGNLPIALNSPLIHHQYLYAGHNEGRMTAYEVKTGKELWSKKDGGLLLYSGKPLFYKDHIIYGTNQGRVYARHYQTGALKYNVDLGSPVDGKGVVYKGRLLFQLRNHKIFCLDVETGKVLWVYRRPVPYFSSLQRVSTPLIKEGVAYIGFADGQIAAFNLEDGMLLWEQKLSSGSKFIDVDVSPILHDNLLYASSMAGPLTVLNPKTGEILRQVDITPSRSVLPWGQKFIVGTIDGEIVVLDKSMKILQKAKVSKRGISGLLRMKQHLVVATLSGEIFLLNKQSLEKVDEFFLGHSYSAVLGEISAAKDKFALLSSRNRLYFFQSLF